jgi:HK97 gp10 family phage protein
MFFSRIPKITREMEPAVAKGIQLAAEMIAAEASSRAPRGGGIHHIADDIHVVRDGHLEYLVRAGKEDTFYGHILEHGSVHAAPHPFLVPALMARRHETVTDIRAAIKAATS